MKQLKWNSVLKHLICICCALSGPQLNAQQIDIAGPTGSGVFGNLIFILANGNYVVVDNSYDDGAIANVGAVYLYNGKTHALISTLKGSTANDQVGNWGITLLSNNAFLVRSGQWSNGSATSAGAITWVNGTTGLNGTVSSSNSLVGSTTNDQVGAGNVVTVLSNGNYVVLTTNWDNGAIVNAGAVTWGNGSTGINGAISSSNSLIGSTASDMSSASVLQLTNGNYIVNCPFWDNGAVVNAGAVTWGSGTAGVSGSISSSNSLTGSSAGDQVGSASIALTNGNYVVSSINWDLGAVANAGAVTWCDGTTGTSGAVTVSNSLVGGNTGDNVGYSLLALNNGNYVVSTPGFNDSYIDAGAVTWGSGTSGVSGAISSSNSLIGASNYDSVGTTVLALSNGNYIVASPSWSDGSTTDAGAVTWGSGTAGISGNISSSNSLIGSSVSDRVGAGIQALSNGNYVVRSPAWDNGVITDAGAVTRGGGTSGITGVVSSTNSLYGTTANDFIGSGGITELTNYNYVIKSPGWDNGSNANAGAATWASGTSSTTGAVSSSNSIIGSTASDQISSSGITALTNGHYLVGSPLWDNGTAVDAGAVTWGNGNTGTSGTVSSTNSLVGSQSNDNVGVSNVVALTNGNYAVGSTLWDNGAVTNAGALTWGNGNSGTSGVISSANSYVGSTASDQIGGNIVVMTAGTFIFRSFTWDNGAITDAGAITWCNGTTAVSGTLSSSNSFVGSTASDQMGSGSTVLKMQNGYYCVKSNSYDNGALTNAGAVTMSSMSQPLTGTVSTCNSMVGTATSAGSFHTIAYNYVYDYLLVGRYYENIVTLLYPDRQALATAYETDSVLVLDSFSLPLVSNNCKLIASVKPNGTGTSLSDSVYSSVWIESVQPADYVKRHVQIAPVSNPASATAFVTLYFTQAEFDDFNNQSPAPLLLLPSGKADATGISNLRIEVRSGITNDGTGRPTTYTGSYTDINPADADIVWDSLFNRWEITFAVTGFGGFFVKTVNYALPLRWLRVSGKLNENNQGVIEWKVQEKNVSHYEVLKSLTGESFLSAGQHNSYGDGLHEYVFTDTEPISGDTYYKVMQTDANGTQSESKIIHLVYDRQQVSVYPNPTMGLCTINTDKTHIGAQARLLDSRGQLLQSFQIQAARQTVDLKGLAPGMYLLQISGCRNERIFIY